MFFCEAFPGFSYVFSRVAVVVPKGNVTKPIMFPDQMVCRDSISRLEKAHHKNQTRSLLVQVAN